MPEELGLSEAAAALGVSTETVRRWIKRGKLQSRKTDDGHVLVTVTRLPGSDQHLTTAPSEDDQQRPAAPGTMTNSVTNMEIARLHALLEAAERHRESLEATVEAQRQQIAALQQHLAAQTQTSAAAESELRQLLLQAQLQVQALIPKLSAPAEEQPERRPWWRWWN